MILVTGGTGFVGRSLIRHLVGLGKPVRTLLRPSKFSPRLPTGVPVEVAVCSLHDERGLRAAMKGVDMIYHLAGSERAGSQADLTTVDIQGTDTVAKVAKVAGVKRLLYLSHLGSDRSSAFPLLKAKAMAENAIIESGVAFTIIRSALIFGKGDQLTSSLAALIKLIPFILLLPADGSTIIQPIWIEDLVTCLAWAMDSQDFEGKLISIGGAEYLTIRYIIEALMVAMETKRILIPLSPAVIRIIALWTEQFYQKIPVTPFFLDYLSVDRIVSLDTVTRLFGLMPARFSQQLGFIEAYL